MLYKCLSDLLVSKFPFSDRNAFKYFCNPPKTQDPTTVHNKLPGVKVKVCLHIQGDYHILVTISFIALQFTKGS